MRAKERRKEGEREREAGRREIKRIITSHFACIPNDTNLLNMFVNTPYFEKEAANKRLFSHIIHFYTDVERRNYSLSKILSYKSEY